MARRISTLVLIGLPVTAVTLWLVSGREIHTRYARVIDVQVRDDLFGETFVQHQMVRGPILGYYVGLDLVILVAIACLATWAITRWVMRRRARLSGGPS